MIYENPIQSRLEWALYFMFGLLLTLSKYPLPYIFILKKKKLFEIYLFSENFLMLGLGYGKRGNLLWKKFFFTDFI